jgi:hypothetical protein
LLIYGENQQLLAIGGNKNDIAWDKDDMKSTVSISGRSSDSGSLLIPLPGKVLEVHLWAGPASEGLRLT